MEKLDVGANRSTRSWSRREQAGRVAWAAARPLFALSPRPMWGWRRWLLRRFGARVGAEAHVYPSARISIPWNLNLGVQCAVGDRATLYALGPIAIGDRATVSQGAHICAGTHDLSRPDRPLIKPPILIGEDVWIAADAFVGPGVTVGAGAVIGARAVVVKDIKPGWIVAGNPAKPIGKMNS
ncbi:putative colanic acid biosynthesis acetyltransferase [Novosphingobium sp. H3SJ31-1]|uniref:Colanic acid biosynthesis acetyltransferase n=1 Tax=Novosphingobium album (ex Liu et al. 2023) TaxID=3031130 RepID=A0ABT5WQU3_9SPHN|nr:putative colanic acid biosynthesis acetyltransferase [Novosphingobium album (ex Liu et al. 2023)]MDE8652416.1 putative colanic acid biosynthesis acetyltransferase [Novosphingobium album (ex Liu et al. 2023)]